MIAGWVGYASVHVIFNNGLGAKREQEVREMQLAYENELNRLRLSYDDLNAQLVLTRDWFSETTDNLEKRHNDLTLVFEQHAAVSDELRKMQESRSQTLPSPISVIAIKPNWWRAAVPAKKTGLKAALSPIPMR